jgi:uncharacterized protein YndB with AHSA1/START domain
MALIYHQIVIKAGRPKVYEILTTQEGASLWFGPDCVFKPQVGFVNEFGIPNQARYKMKVIHLQPGFSVEWKCVNQHDDWSGTQLSFHLSDKNGSTCLDFKHSGFASESESYAATNYQWAILLTLLRQVCEKTELAAPILNVPLAALNVTRS